MAGLTNWNAGLAGWNPNNLNGYGNADAFKQEWTQYVNSLSGPGGGGSGPTTYGKYGGVMLAGSASNNPAIAMYQQLQAKYNNAAKSQAEAARRAAGWTGKNADIAPNGARGSAFGTGWGQFASPDAWKEDINRFGQDRVNENMAKTSQRASDYQKGIADFWAQQNAKKAQQQQRYGQPPQAPAPAAPTPATGAPPAAPAQYMGMPQSPMNQPSNSPQLPGMPPAAPRGAPAWWQAMMANKPSMQQAQAAALRGPGAV